MEKLKELLLFFDRHPHPPKSCRHEPFLSEVQAACVEMMARDGPVSLMDNTQGQLCPSYPLQIVLPHATEEDTAKIAVAVERAKYARYRQRFAVPAFAYRGSWVCRSAAPSDLEHIQSYVPCDDAETHYQHDRALLSQFSVHYLLNMMSEETVEEHGVRCCLAEQVASRELYSSPPLQLCVVPYPGVKLFDTWRQGGYNGNIPYDWSKCSAELEIPAQLHAADDEWPEHKSWDLVTLTQKYFGLMLSLLVRGGGGLLVHCRSGWDRTPMWLSLLRLSLWADGEVHQSLSADEIVYLTVAYDWLLFGHDFAGRRSKGQEIMLFTFHFLLAVLSADYSVHTHIRRQASKASTGKSEAGAAVLEQDVGEPSAHSAETRERKLRDVHHLFTQAYAQCFFKT